MVEGGGLILLVEDDRQIQEVVRMVLEDEGYTVIAAGSQEDALLRLAEQTPDVVILDLGLPNVGEEGPVAAAQATVASGARLVICSAAGYSAQEIARRLRGDAYLSKPFDIDDLIGTVRRALELQR